MKTILVVLACLAPILLLAATPFAVAGEGCTIHPFEHGTLISRTSYPGKKVGCLTSGTTYTLYIDFYYTDLQDDDQRITSLTLESSTDGGTTWNPVPGATWDPASLPIDVPWSGKTGIGQLVTTDPHITVAVTFPVTGDIGDLFYYRVHFTSYVYGPGHPGNAGNHYIWYDICGVEIPEFSEASLAMLMSILVTFVYLRRHKTLPLFLK